MSVAVDIVQELLALFLALAIWRYIQGKVDPTTTTGKALAYVLH